MGIPDATYQSLSTYRYVPVHTILPDPVQVDRIPDVRDVQLEVFFSESFKA